MRPLFMLSIGQPGSSFAIEIARKTGLPEEVIRDASDIVGNDYVQSDKYLQDIIRDKRYWESKRQNIHGREKQLEQLMDRYEQEMQQLQQQRKSIMARARQEAEELLGQANSRIENTIREIREQQAEREATRQIRGQLKQFHETIADDSLQQEEDQIDRKMRQLQERRARKEQRRREKAIQQAAQGGAEDASSANAYAQGPNAEDRQKSVFTPDQYVRIKGMESIGRIESIQGQMATIIFGDLRTKMRTDRLEAAEAPQDNMADSPAFMQRGRMTRNLIDEHQRGFSQDLDIRGMRLDEGVNAVMHYIDDAILMGVSRVRILHGTGSGVLRQETRKYLRTVPNVAAYRDEHVQFGGAGITVVDLD
jgi:DNA mismatch repair protein MutS2